MNQQKTRLRQPALTGGMLLRVNQREYGLTSMNNNKNSPTNIPCRAAENSQ